MNFAVEPGEQTDQPDSVNRNRSRAPVPGQARHSFITRGARKIGSLATIARGGLEKRKFFNSWLAGTGGNNFAERRAETVLQISAAMLCWIR